MVDFLPSYQPKRSFDSRSEKSPIKSPLKSPTKGYAPSDFSGINYDGEGESTPHSQNRKYSILSGELGGNEDEIKNNDEGNKIAQNIITIYYSKNSFYKGSVNESYQPEGFGEYCYENGDVYNGNFINGKRHGKGQYLYKESKMEFSGNWKDDLKDGDGFFKNLSENFEYKCKFKNDELISSFD